MTSTHHVYGLYEKFDNHPFYVGVSMHPRRRLSAHKAAAAGRRKDALTGCGVKAEDITMRLLCQCDDRGHAETVERALQVHYGIKIVRQEILRREENGV